MYFFAEEKYVKVLGRTRMIERIRYLDYSCSAIEFLFTGKKAEAVLWTNSEGFEEHLKAWVAVFVDDEEVPSKRFPLLMAEDTYTLYEGTKEKETKLRLVKYSEAAFGKVGVKNWTDLEVPNDDWLMSCLYPYTDKAIDLDLGNPEPEVWDSDRYVPDCIIINLGTNDNSFTRGIAEREETFGTMYYSFIKQVRSINPDSTILCTLGAMGQELCGQIKKQVERLAAEGDDKIYDMSFHMQSVKDGIGSDWHPSKTTHDRMAVKLEDRVREIMGW